MDIFDRLKVFSLSKLRDVCGVDWLAFREIVEEEGLSDIDNVVNIIRVFYGTTILEEQKFRALFLETLDPDKLYSLAEELASTSYRDSSVLNAKVLSRLTWNEQSEIAKIFRAEMGFTDEFMPTENKRNAVVENIYPTESLPGLFEYQKEVIEKAFEKVSGNILTFLIQLPTGAGKTRILMEFLARFVDTNENKVANNSILWLAHSEELIEQAVETFKKVWRWRAKTRGKIVRLYGSYNPAYFDLKDAFIFGSLQKIASIEKNKKEIFQVLSNEIAVIVIDEAHKTTAPTFRRAVNTLTSKKGIALIGITATPGRSTSDNIENRDFANYFNNELIQPSLGTDAIKTLRNLGVLAQVNREVVNTGVEVNDLMDIDSDDLTLKTLKNLGRSRKRNKLLIEIIRSQYNLGRPTLAFCCSVEHSKILCVGLSMLGIKAAYLDHNKSRSARRQIIKNFRSGRIDVLLNYGILSTGFDAPNIQSVIIARPTSSLILYSQMVGRGMRGPKVGGNKLVNIVDVKDNIASFGDMDLVYNHFSSYWSN